MSSVMRVEAARESRRVKFNPLGSEILGWGQQWTSGTMSARMRLHNVHSDGDDELRMVQKV